MFCSVDFVSFIFYLGPDRNIHMRCEINSVKLAVSAEAIFLTEVHRYCNGGLGCNGNPYFKFS
jgi:hypothetical protein